MKQKSKYRFELWTSEGIVFRRYDLDRALIAAGNWIGRQVKLHHYVYAELYRHDNENGGGRIIAFYRLNSNV
jgi:hypothetical protein